MAILKRPMFRKGGSANSGIMDGLERRNYANSNWEDIAKAYGSSYGQDTSTHYGPRSIERYLDKDAIEQMIEHYKPIEKDWSWLEPKKHKVTLPSGEEIWTKGGMPINKEELVQDPYRSPEFVTMPFPQSDEKITPPPEKKDDGSIDSATLADAKETVSDLNKKYMKMMAPHMQKRMVADAWGAASRSFEESTGDTKQDIARALGAAGEAMGGTRELADKISMLTLSGEIQKDIEASKKVKPSNFESAVSAWRNIKDEKGDPKYSLEEALEKASGKQTESAKFYEIQKEFGKGEAIAHQQKDNPNFWGSYSKMDKKELKKLPDSAIGMIIYDETENSFYTISVNDEGEKEKKFLSRA